MGSPPSTGTRSKPDIRGQMCETGGSFDLEGHQPGKDKSPTNVQEGSDSSRSEFMQFQQSTGLKKLLESPLNSINLLLRSQKR